MFSEEGGEERSQRQVQLLGAGASVEEELLQIVLGRTEEAGAAVRLEGTSC